MGMGALHMSSANAQTEDSLFKAVNPESKVKVYTDYVFGRMMKTEFSVNEAGELSVSPEKPRSDYQSWARKYASGSEMIAAVNEA